MSTPKFAPARFATYNGDARHMIGEVKGPTHNFSEYLTAVTADYDTEADKTRVGFAFGIHPEVRDER